MVELVELALGLVGKEGRCGALNSRDITIEIIDKGRGDGNDINGCLTLNAVRNITLTLVKPS